MRAIVAVLDRKGDNAVQTAVLMLSILKHKSADTFGIATQNHVMVKTSPEQLPIREFKSSTAVGHVFLKVLARDKPQPVKMEKAALVFDGRIYQPHDEPSDVEFAAHKLQTSFEENAEVLTRECDGCFAFAVAEDGRLIIGRDSLGLYPLYYGESHSLFAAASECKALWKIGLKEAKSFPPGYVAVADKRGLKLKPIKVLKSPSISAITAEEAAEKLRKILEDSAKERVSGLKEVAVAFSGGLDSSLTALLAKKAGIKVHLVHVSLENRPETVQAKEAAALLDMPIHTYLYSEEDVEKVLPKVLWTVESPNPVKVSIGVPIFWTAEKAAEQGFRVLLTGQGADELFGGYRRYLNVYSRFGEKAVENALVHDALTMHENNFERDSKICAFHNIEPRLPFASYHLAEFALSLPLNLKIESKSDLLRKIVLRRVAEKLELPPQIVAKLKRAVQYATGTSKVIKKIARREKISVKQYLQKLFSKTFEGF